MITSFKLPEVYNGVANKLILDSLEFKDGVLGAESTSYTPINEDVVNLFNSISVNIRLDEANSGFFRKPFSFIHIEEHPPEASFIGIIAIAPTTIKIHKHVETGATGAYQVEKSTYEILDDAAYEDRFEDNDVVNLQFGESYFLQPTLFHSVHSELVQIVYLSHKQTICS